MKSRLQNNTMTMPTTLIVTLIINEQASLFKKSQTLRTVNKGRTSTLSQKVCWKHLLYHPQIDSNTQRGIINTLFKIMRCKLASNNKFNSKQRQPFSDKSIMKMMEILQGHLPSHQEIQTFNLKICETGIEPMG